MSRITKIVFAILGIALCVLCYSCYKWHSYKLKYTRICQEMEHIMPCQDTLNDVDKLVISGNGDVAYQTCNRMYSNYTFMPGYKDIAISPRDYFLYCYIFALRDKNTQAAAEFSTYYLDDVESGKIVLDTSMLKVVIGLAKQVVSDTLAQDAPLCKFLVANKLKNIYSGAYLEKLKDTVLEQQYKDLTQIGH